MTIRAAMEPAGTWLAPGGEAKLTVLWAILHAILQAVKVIFG